MLRERHLSSARAAEKRYRTRTDARFNELPARFPQSASPSLSDEMKAAIAKSVAAMRSVKVPALGLKLPRASL